MREPETIVIDGYNLIKRVPALAARLDVPDGLNSARSYLLGTLRAYQSRRGKRVVLVLDGPRANRSDFGPVEVLYAVAADDAVVSRAGPGCLVVSSDNAVRQGAVGRGASVLSSEDFWQALLASAAPRRGATARAPTAAGRLPGRRDDFDRDGPERAKPTRGNPRRRSKAEKRREQARADLMRRV